MNNAKTLINTAALTAYAKEHGQVPAIALGIESIEGYILQVDLDGQINVLSTYLSDKPRVFKRADALLKEAKKMGLTTVSFSL